MNEDKNWPTVNTSTSDNCLKVFGWMWSDEFREILSGHFGKKLPTREEEKKQKDQ
jgi:hypothetical protein